MLKPSLQLKLSQQLTMTPQLQQAIRLLQLPVMELQTQIQTALDENVMLEVEEPEASPEDGQTAESSQSESDDPEEFADAEPEVAVAAEADWEDTQKTGPPEAPKSAEPRTTVEYADRSEETLRDHLLWQLELENLDPRTTAIGQADHRRDQRRRLHDRTTPDDPRDALRRTFSYRSRTSRMPRQARAAIRSGRASARAPVSECVQLQLKQLSAETPGLDLAMRIAAEHLPLVAEHQYGVLKRLFARRTATSRPRSLSSERANRGPEPMSSLAPPEYVVPDVFVRRHEGQWVVELNNSMSPQLRVNQLYAGSLGARRGV